MANQLGELVFELAGSAPDRGGIRPAGEELGDGGAEGSLDAGDLAVDGGEILGRVGLVVLGETGKGEQSVGVDEHGMGGFPYRGFDAVGSNAWTLAPVRASIESALGASVGTGVAVGSGDAMDAMTDGDLESQIMPDYHRGLPDLV